MLGGISFIVIRLFDWLWKWPTKEFFSIYIWYRNIKYTYQIWLSILEARIFQSKYKCISTSISCSICFTSWYAQAWHDFRDRLGLSTAVKQRLLGKDLRLRHAELMALLFLESISFFRVSIQPSTESSPPVIFCIFIGITCNSTLTGFFNSSIFHKTLVSTPTNTITAIELILILVINFTIFFCIKFEVCFG